MLIEKQYLYSSKLCHLYYELKVGSDIFCVTNAEWFVHQLGHTGFHL